MKSDLLQGERRFMFACRTVKDQRKLVMPKVQLMQTRLTMTQSPMLLWLIANRNSRIIQLMTHKSTSARNSLVQGIR